MMKKKKNLLGFLLLAVLMTVTGSVLLKGQTVSLLLANLKRLQPGYLVLGLGLMFGYVSCEAICSRQILRHLGHCVPLKHCLGYSLVGFYFSSITPSATGGQPAQIYYMSRDEIPVAHGALNMMLIASCYQVAALIWGGSIWMLVPSVREIVDGGLKLLLLYGAGMMLLLTLGMLMFMFLPGPSRRLCGAVLTLAEKLHLLRKPEIARHRLEHMLSEYNRGAACVKKNPGLAVRVLALCLVQQGLLFSVPWSVYLAFGLSGAGWLQIAGLQALLTLAVCNLPLPGAVGPAEGGFVKAFGVLFGAELVTPAMLVSRGISFYAFLAISSVAAIAVHLRTARSLRERALQEMTENQTGERIRAVRSYLKEKAENF